MAKKVQNLGKQCVSMNTKLQILSADYQNLVDLLRDSHSFENVQTTDILKSYIYHSSKLNLTCMVSFGHKEDLKL